MNIKIKIFYNSMCVASAEIVEGGPNVGANREQLRRLRQRLSEVAKGGGEVSVEEGSGLLSHAQKRAWEIALQPHGDEARRVAGFVEFQGKGRPWRIYLRERAEVRNSPRWGKRRTYAGSFPATAVSEAMIERPARSLRKPGALRRVTVVLRGDRPVRVEAH